MSQPLGEMHHPASKLPAKVFVGFNWPCLWFGPFWYASKTVWKWAAISLVLTIVTYGLALFVFPFFANKQYIQSLIEKGYTVENQLTRDYLVKEGLLAKD